MNKYAEYHKQYYQKNREKIKARVKAYTLKNLDKYREYWKEYDREHRNLTKQSEYGRKYNATEHGKVMNKLARERNRFSRNIYYQRRCRNLRSLTVEVAQQVYEENIKKYGTLTCELCFKPIKFGQDSLEHFHPVSRKDEYPGDINEYKNLGVAHGPKSKENCNTRKNNKTLKEWFDGSKFNK